MHQASGENCSAESLKALTVGHPCCFCRRPHAPSAHFLGAPRPTGHTDEHCGTVRRGRWRRRAQCGQRPWRLHGRSVPCAGGGSQGSTSDRRFPNDDPPPLAVCVRNSDSSNNTKIQLAVGEQWCSTTSSLSLSFSFPHPTEPVPFLSASIFSPMTPLVMIPPPLLLSHRRAPLLLSVTRRALSG